MGANSAPSSPSVEPNDAGPVMSATGVCCWCQDYAEEIHVPVANSRYYRRHHDGVPAEGVDQKWFKLYVSLRSGLIKVEVRFKFEGHAPTTQQEVAKAIEGLKKAAEDWSGHIAIKIEDPECGERELPVVFDAVEVSSSQHYLVGVFQSMPPEHRFDGQERAHVEGNIMRVLTSTKAWTYAHEFAHCLGLPDEYGYWRPVREQVWYMRPEGPAAADAPIDVDTRGAASFGGDLNIMSTPQRYKRAMRHGYFVAIEVQTLLTRVLDRTIRCKVVRPAE